MASFIAARPTAVSAPESVGTTHPVSDERLLQRIAAGDQLAMRVLFARHQVRVYRFVLRTARDETLAEDVLSEVFLDVWKQAARFEARSTVSTWLLAIARNKALSALRSRPQHVELNDGIAETCVDTADTPDLAVEKKSRSEVIRQCIANLSAEQREVIDLVCYHSKSISEGAEIVKVPEATVKTRYARKKLAGWLDAT